MASRSRRVIDCISHQFTGHSPFLISKAVTRHLSKIDEAYKSIKLTEKDPDGC